MGKILHSEHEITAYDCIQLYGQLWQPEYTSKTVILLSHGLSDRSERFIPWAEKFADSGFGFCCFDTRGNGKSEGKRGHCNRFEDFLLDVDHCLEFVKSKFPDIPIILYGHSMGGNVIANYLLQRQPIVLAAIITSPWLKLTNEPGELLKLIAKIAYRIIPELDQKANINAHHLTDNHEVVQKYIDDQLIHDRITPAGFVNISKAGLWAMENADQLSVPTLLMQEEGDRITSFMATKEFAKQAGTICHFKKWEGRFHELHHEPFRDEVFKYIVNWIGQQSSGGSSQ